MASSRGERVTVCIDSKDRVSGTTSDFQITLLTPLKRVASVEIVSVEVPFTFYALNANNNVLKFTDGTTTYTVTIPPGNYDALTFASVLKNLMNAIFPAVGFTITYGIPTYKFTWSNATAFNIVFATSTIAPIIGLTANSGLVTEFTSQGSINLSGPNYFQIRSVNLTRPKKILPYFQNIQDNILYKVVISSGPGSTIIEKNLYPDPIKYATRQKIQSFDLTLLDPDGNTLDLNGQRWSMTMVFAEE